MKKTIRLILKSLGEQLDREGLKDTPYRIEKMLPEIFDGYNKDPNKPMKRQFTTKSKGIVLIHNISLYSICEHHGLPFTGVCHVAYIPIDNKIIGLSKIVRMIEIYAHRLQTQEHLTYQIVENIVKNLSSDCMVMTDMEHGCMRIRGIKNPTVRVKTTEVRGGFKSYDVKDEFYQMLGNK